MKILQILTILFLVLSGVGCGSSVERPDYAAVVASNEVLKATPTESIPFAFTPLTTVQRCLDSLICMSEDDFRSSEADKTNISALSKTLQLEIQSRIRANNHLVDALSHEMVVSGMQEFRADQLQKALDKRDWQTIFERLLSVIFIGLAL